VITIVYDNNPDDERLETAWGFACIIKGLPKTILFDTGGNGNRLLSNMVKVGLEPEHIDAVVLSHKHGDHTGGLHAFLEANSKVKVFMPKSFPSSFKLGVRQLGAAVVETEHPCEICEGVWTTGVLKQGVEEQGIFIETRHGLVVITGCAHPGIVSMATAAKGHAGQTVYAVVGGFHMSAASADDIGSVVSELKRLGVQQVAPCHCSGDLTRALMRKAFTEGYLLSGVGARIDFKSRVGAQDH
jgi:7,8-dihydropterin-6-yl-methyl-4-(beta-D-ribofuranosyl)aminobenzene 5'-phosphate synthase